MNKFIHVCVAACLLIGIGTAQDLALTPDEMMKIRFPIQAEVSPDGSLVAYVLLVPRKLGEPDGGAWRELHVVSSGGGLSRGLVTGEVAVSSAAWRPGTDTIAFRQRREGDKSTRIYAMPPEGGEPHALTSDDTTVGAYSFSPDGKRIAAIVRPPASPKQREDAKRGFNQVVYEEGGSFARVALIDVATGKTVEIDTPGHAIEVAFSPDGRSVFFTSAPNDLVDESYMEKDLYLADLTTGKVSRIADVPGKFGSFAPSPDGKLIAYTAGQDRNDPAVSGLYVANRDGSNARQIRKAWFDGGAEFRGRHPEHVAWLDGNTLLVEVAEGVNSAIVAMPLGNESGFDTAVAPGAVVTHGFTLSADGTHMAFLGATPGHPREAYAQALGRFGNEEASDAAEWGTGPFKRLTDSNPWLARVTLGEQIAIAYPARDGLTVDGLLIKPVGFRDGQRYPLIVVAHGGPESRYANEWNTRYADPGQMAAGQGYLVFYPNYRASTGRGSAYSRLDQGDMGGKEFDDVIDGVDWLVKKGWADPDSVGITGGSYGGYFTAWGSTKHTDRFAAGVMFVGISDNLSKMGTTDIPMEMLDVHWTGKTPWDDMGLFLDRSPFMYAKGSKTPLLILHGRDDPRVSYTQSLELYRWMKMTNPSNPVRLILYPGEGHGNRRFASQYDYALRMMRWFDRFLKDPSSPATLPPHDLDYGYGVEKEAPVSGSAR